MKNCFKSVIYSSNQYSSKYIYVKSTLDISDHPHFFEISSLLSLFFYLITCVQSTLDITVPRYLDYFFSSLNVEISRVAHINFNNLYLINYINNYQILARPKTTCGYSLRRNSSHLEERRRLKSAHFQDSSLKNHHGKIIL